MDDFFWVTMLPAVDKQLSGITEVAGIVMR